MSGSPSVQDGTVSIKHHLSERFSYFCRSDNWIPEFVMGIQIGTNDFKLLEFCSNSECKKPTLCRKLEVSRSKYQLLTRIFCFPGSWIGSANFSSSWIDSRECLCRAYIDDKVSTPCLPLNWSFATKCPRVFSFGRSLISWIHSTSTCSDARTVLIAVTSRSMLLASHC